MTIRRFLMLASLLALAVAPAAAVAAPTAVDVRIEGKTSTIFSGPVTTDGKTVTTTSGGTHVCDGTNNGVSPVPVANATSALDDAAVKGGFDWDGSWSGPGYPDYFITRVAGESQSATEFWGVFVNGVVTTAGGCQSPIKAGDEVLWAFDAFSKVGALKLSAPAAARTGESIPVRVANRATGAPIADAAVGSATTGADGTAALKFDEPGVYRLKAEKTSYIRSSEVRVCVDPPLVEACTSTDRTAPSIENNAPAISSSTTRFNYVRLAWLGDDGQNGSGVRRYRVEQRRLGVANAAWLPLVTDGSGTEKRFHGAEGRTYEVRVQAIDRAGNASDWASRTTTVPFDNLSNGLKLSQRGWTTLRRQGAFKLSVSRATRKGASATMRFSGSQATVVTRKLPNGGRVRITVDGKSKVVSLKGKGRFRQTLVGSGQLGAGEHVLSVTSLGRAPVEIDAIAVKP